MVKADEGKNFEESDHANEMKRIKNALEIKIESMTSVRLKSRNVLNMPFFLIRKNE